METGLTDKSLAIISLSDERWRILDSHLVTSSRRMLSGLYSPKYTVLSHLGHFDAMFREGFGRDQLEERGGVRRGGGGGSGTGQSPTDRLSAPSEEDGGEEDDGDEDGRDRRSHPPCPRNSAPAR
ncbi:hypothetical protein F2P81_024528 [Scophthalmus maximus]|uniref:Uncharacterized protein n=1 Tax=Scophthalmus maximus TaxID=52904 RepID=A0A6A4RV45_SCOMX|nr:hypothetical protein F2P81_024528 [Scophthalmus maximus]